MRCTSSPQTVAKASASASSTYGRSSSLASTHAEAPARVASGPYAGRAWRRGGRTASRPRGRTHLPSARATWPRTRARSSTKSAAGVAMPNMTLNQGMGSMSSSTAGRAAAAAAAAAATFFFAWPQLPPPPPLPPPSPLASRPQSSTKTACQSQLGVG